MSTGYKGPTAYQETKVYTDDESVYLKAIQEYIESLKAKGRRFPTNIELTQVILQVAHELGYRKLEGLELAEYDAQAAQQAEEVERAHKEEIVFASRRAQEQEKHEQGAVKKWLKRKKRPNRND
jgi:hypothetical protein